MLNVHVKKTPTKAEYAKSINTVAILIVKFVFFFCRDFLHQCLLLCLEKKRGKLRHFVDIVEDCVASELPERRGERDLFWKEVFEGLYEKAVMMEDSKALREALVSAHDCVPVKVRFRFRSQFHCLFC